MTDSLTEYYARARHALLALSLCAAALGLSVGCAQHVPPPKGAVLMPLKRPPTWLPEPSDQIAAKAAAAALANNQKLLDEQVKKIYKVQDTHKGEDLEVLTQDLAHSTLNDPRAYRKASKNLTSGYGTDPAVQARLDLAVKNDPLALAWRRRLDTWETYWARTFNAVAKTVGQSVLSGFVLAPVQLATTVGHYLASFSNDEKISTSGRQELVLHKEYLARHGNAENAEAVQKRIETNEKRLATTMQKRRLKAAKAATKAQRHRVAIVESKRALAWGHHDDAVEIKESSEESLREQLHILGLSLVAANQEGFKHGDEWDVTLATELLLTSSHGEVLSEETIEVLREQAYSDGPRSGESLYIFAMVQEESGYPDQSWATLKHLALQKQGQTPMARHAHHLINDPWQNPYGAYRSMLSQRTAEKWRWRVLGGYANGTRYPNLPRPVAYTLEGPGIASTVATSPLRMVFGSFSQEPNFQRPAALLAYRYLGLHPKGEHKQEVLHWLFEYEEKRKNYNAALRLADFIPNLSSHTRKKLAEEASAQALAAAQRSKRIDRRIQILRQASKEFPDTESGMLAGKQVRSELVHSSPQKIRMTRDFLKQNPSVSGDSGLGLNPELINGELNDGELHPSGVSMLGGRKIQINMVAHGADEDTPPHKIKKQISQERLAKLASSLEETTHRNQLIDQDDSLEADADRDRFLERARVGLTGKTDHRPSAQSTYVYKSMRERYGLVRGRESILPFDLVFQGNFQDLGLGAFPRWRLPEETPDAFLYK
ncbi:MAG: hypothetical protein CL917_04255 [Deltaproteobacteria bacterium]|nr:hypothetical protein [Deltaproteobacteria bacterium]